MVTEVLHSSKSKEHGVAFRFAVEVGAKRLEREEFVWRKGAGSREDGTHPKKTGGSRYALYRLGPSSSSSSSSSAAAATASTSASAAASAPDGPQIVVELAFDNVLSLKHMFTLELMGAGRTGELGDRWALMVVMTALAIHWLRQNGRTTKGTVAAAQKIHSRLGSSASQKEKEKGS